MMIQVETIMELLEVCLRTTCFQRGDESLQVKDGMAVESSLSFVIININISKNLFLTQHKTNHRPGSIMLLTRL
jgi:hypothetical protein